jgi:hypothetical protein
MGNVIEKIFPCFRDDKVKIPKVDDKELKEVSIDLGESTNDEFYCPKCDNVQEIPEILTIHSDSSIIGLRCHKREKNYFPKLEEYCSKIKGNSEQKCSKEGCTTKTDYYCLGCMKFFCAEDVKVHAKDHEEEQTIFNGIDYCLCSCLPSFGKYKNNEIHKLVKKEEITSTCSTHGLKTEECCQECQKNVCKICKDEYHKRHNINNPISAEKMKDAKEKIIKKTNKLLSMIKFYRMVNAAYEKNTDNITYQKNIVNVAESIKREKDRDKNDIDLAIYRINQIKKGINLPLS